MPLALFAVLALATVGAFYLTQHLKVQNPLINGAPRADPAVINPRYAGMCVDANGDRRSFASTRIAFYLQSRSDTVTVTVHDAEADATPVLATMAGSNRHYAAGPTHYDYFAWNGHLSDGAYAPAGRYTFFVTLSRQGRNFPITGQSVQVRSARPTPRVTQVTVNGAGAAPAGTTPAFAPGHAKVTLALRTGTDIGANVLIYHASASRSAPLTLVKTFGINSRHRTAVWDGRIQGRPAPAGTYLMGLAVTDDSCTRGQFPATIDPAPGTTAGAGVNVSYLSADPPMKPVPAGQVASVPIVAASGHYTWRLRSAGRRAPIDASTGSSRATLRVRLPEAGLYELHVTSGHRSTTVPLVASAVGPRAAAKVLVVLPALSWQGANATDDNSDGLIDTLADGSQVSLERPLVAGLPQGVGDEAALLRFLTAQGYRYDVTTDVALAEGVGPTLTGRSGVILDGTFSWLPTQLVGRLAQFVTRGGGVFSDGIHSLQATAEVTDGNDGPIAGPARRAATDPFGVRHGAVASSDGQSILEFTDGLNIFSSAVALEFPRYQVLEPPHAGAATVAGVAATSPAVLGLHLGTGTVVEVGLPDFGSSLASDVDSGELLSRVWQVVLR